jgi:hypothetical protein
MKIEKMTHIPSFLNRLDFISILLPGYVSAVVYLLMFDPARLLSAGSTSLDLFSTVVFLVAGPALGLTLQQFQRGLPYIKYYIENHLARDRKKKEKKEEFVTKYASVRLKMTSEERLELDEVEAFYDFSASTGIALLVLSIAGFWRVGRIELLFALVLLVALVILIGGFMHRNERYSPLIDLLIEKYSN